VGDTAVDFGTSGSKLDAPPVFLGTMGGSIITIPCPRFPGIGGNPITREALRLG
jgi:hypothetical protein